MKTFRIKSVEELENIAGQILCDFPDHRIFALYGKMGAGKTTFIKAFSSVMEVKDEVRSPSFSLINEYYSTQYGSIYHFDFYRLENIEEVLEIGYEDYFFSGHYCFLEWPGKISELLPAKFVYCTIDITESQERIISIRSSD